MKYSNQEIFNSVKEIMLDMYPHIPANKITKDASFKWSLGLDSLDRLEILMEFEKKYNISIEDTSRIEKISSLGEYCYILYKHMHPELFAEKTNISTKEDVFKHIDAHLKDKYYIMNAKPNDNLFMDLHFNNFDRLDLCTWAEETFGIRLPSTYFITLEDFCDKIFSSIQRKKLEQKQTQIPLLTNIKSMLQRKK